MVKNLADVGIYTSHYAPKHLLDHQMKRDISMIWKGPKHRGFHPLPPPST